MRLKGGQHLRWGVGREEQGLQLRLDKIAMRGAQGIKIGLEQHLEGAQIDQIARLHHLQQGLLIDNALNTSRSEWRWHCQLNEKSLTDAFLVRKADSIQVAKIEAIVKEENER
jgi:hypothetical protein